MRNLPRGLGAAALILAALALALGTALPGTALAVSDAELRKAEAALQTLPTNDANRAELARLLYLKGSDFSRAGDAAAAAGEFKQALGVLEDRRSKLPQQYPVFEEARYGLGYSYLAMGQPQNAVVVLDQLVAASPGCTRGRYLLGVALLRTGSEAGVHRGAQVLAQLAKEAPAPDGPAAMRAVSRYELNLAAGFAAAGQPFAAEDALQDVRERLGPASGANTAENQALMFGLGVTQMWAGNASAGLADYESLKSQNAGYRLKNGVTLRQVLSDAYYQAGLEQLSHRGDAALQQAVAYFDRAEANGTGKEVDTHHGKAIAYKRMKQPDKMALELGAVLKLNPEYFNKINTGS